MYIPKIPRFEPFVEETVTEWIEHSMLPDDITVMNIQF